MPDPRLRQQFQTGQAKRTSQTGDHSRNQKPDGHATIDIDPRKNGCIRIAADGVLPTARYFRRLIEKRTKRTTTIQVRIGIPETLVPIRGTSPECLQR
jgi:hypothetical protein